MSYKKREQFKEKGLDFSLLQDKEKFLEFLKVQSLNEKYKTKASVEEILKTIQEEILKEEILVPLSICTRNISTLESVIKYLKENCHLKNKKIASLLNKSEKSIWQAYRGAHKKHPQLLAIVETKYSIPISLFKQRKSVLGSVVMHLRDHDHLSYHDIALIVKRNERTVWTIYQREKNATR